VSHARNRFGLSYRSGLAATHSGCPDAKTLTHGVDDVAVNFSSAGTKLDQRQAFALGIELLFYCRNKCVRESRAARGKIEWNMPGLATGHLNFYALIHRYRYPLPGDNVQAGAVMIRKCVAVIFTGLSLAGCCASGTMCEVPTAGTHVAWDGLGPDPSENASARPPKATRPRTASARTSGEVPGERKVQAGSEWERQLAADKADEARLSRTMIICRGCSAASSPGDGNTGSTPVTR